MDEELQHLPKAPFSVHARGVQLLDRNRLLDGQYIGLSAFRSLRDISGSLYTFLLIQGWLSVWSSLITIISVVFFALVPPRGQAAATDWTVPAFAVLLPLFGLVWWAFQRREGALRDLAQVKTLVLHVSLAHRDWLPPGRLPPGHALTVQHTLHVLLEGMRSYFLPSRFYSREYPFTRVKAGMMQVAQHRAKQTRRLTAGFRRLARSTEALRRAGLGDAQAAQLAAWAQQLHAAVERMANVKEYRTPQGIRALVRCYCTLLLPIFFGPHYASLRGSISLVYALFLAVVLNLAIIGVLHAAMALEDPFDNLGLDGIYIDEAVFDIEQAIKMDEDAELGGSGARGDAAAPRLPPAPGPPGPPPGSTPRDPPDGDFSTHGAPAFSPADPGEGRPGGYAHPKPSHTPGGLPLAASGPPAYYGGFTGPGRPSSGAARPGVAASMPAVVAGGPPGAERAPAALPGDAAGVRDSGGSSGGRLPTILSSG